MTGPTFCARFNDGTEVRMTTWHANLETLDLRRGIRLARYAHETRAHNRKRHTGFHHLFEPPYKAPGLSNARFEDEDGAVLAEYTAEQLAKE